MNLSPPILSRRPQVVDASDLDDKRLHLRFAMPLAGRYMRADKTEHVCKVNDISVGGVSLAVPISKTGKVVMDEKIVAYIDSLGGLEGQVVRIWTGGFAFKILATQHKREKLASQITWLLNEPDLQGAAARQHERIQVTNRNAEMTLLSGVSLPCLLLDVSLSGASVACRAKPDIDEEVRLSRFRARVVRHHSEGVGLQFIENLDPDTLRAYFA
jgi:hypothetical protein